MNKSERSKRAAEYMHIFHREIGRLGKVRAMVNDVTFFLFVCVLFCFVFPFLHHRPMFRSCFGFFFNRTTFKGCVQGACLTLAQPVLGLLFRGGRCRYSTSLRPAASASRCTVCFLATVFDIRVV